MKTMITDYGVFGFDVKIEVSYGISVRFRYLDAYHFDFVKFHSIYNGTSRALRPSNKSEFIYLAIRHFSDSDKAQLVYEELENAIKKIRS